MDDSGPTHDDAPMDDDTRPLTATPAGTGDPVQNPSWDAGSGPTPQTPASRTGWRERAGAKAWSLRAVVATALASVVIGGAGGAALAAAGKHQDEQGSGRGGPGMGRFGAPGGFRQNGGQNGQQGGFGQNGGQNGQLNGQQNGQGGVPQSQPGQQGGFGGPSGQTRGGAGQTTPGVPGGSGGSASTTVATGRDI